MAPYAIGNFTVVNSAFANGSLTTPDAGRSLVLTGPNDGSGLGGQTEATVICRGSGVFRFRYAYATLDSPGYDSAGYLLNGQFFPLANADNVSGIVSVTANAGDVLGFRVASADNTGEPGILTLTEFSFPPSLTVTAISSSPNPSAFGQAVVFVATVTSAGGSPSGSVTFKDGAATLGTVTLNGAGQATLAAATLAVGDHSITASYLGNSSFGPSTSPTLVQAVRPGATVTTVSSSSKPSVFGQPVTFTATVTTVIPGTGIPTGAVTFKDGNSLLATAVLNGAGVATFATSSLTIGGHSLTAAYASDGRYSASTSAALIQTVNPAATTTALTASSTTITKGQSVTFTAAVSVAAPGAGAPTGVVLFKEGAATLGSASLNSNFQATFATASLSPGTHAITAVYGGDSNFNGSTSPPLSEVVSRAPTTTMLAPVGGPVVAGDCITLSAAVNSSAGTPTGTVTFRSGSLVIRAAPVNASGTATATNVCLNIGSYLIAAEYGGDSNFLGSTSPGAPFDVDAIPTKVTEPVLRSGSPLAGETLTFEAKVTSEGRLTGVIRFSDGYTSLGTAPIDDQGTAVLTARLAIGLHLITAYYEGDVMHAPSRSEPLFQTIRGVAAVKLVSSANPAGSGAAVVLTATVSAPQGVSIEPTGSVAFMEGAASLGTAALSGGQASIKAPPGLAAGEHTIVAQYSGDSNYTASASAPLTQRVLRAPTTTALDAGVDNTGYFLVATVACPSASGSGSVPTGAVQFEDAGRSAAIGSATLANGSATLRLPAPVPVGRPLRAAYAGDAVCDASNSTVLPFIAAANAFSFNSLAFAPDAIASVFGENFASTTAAAPPGPLPRTIEGVSVDIVDASGRSHAAGLYFASPSQINFVFPADVPPGPARIVVTKAGTTAALTMAVSRVAPALATLNGSGSGPAAAYFVRVHADGSQDPAAVVSAAPQAFGSASDRMYLILYGTGFRNAPGSPACVLNGQPAPALYAGPHSAYPGLDQINLELPETLRGAGVVTVSCAVEGHSANSVSINVQ